jgi:hypothetical protein
MQKLANKRIKTLCGFSLIEVLFSMAMFMGGIFAVAGLINHELVKSMDRRNEAIAGQLAQEGIELVRNIRDNNWFKSDPPFDNIGKTTSGTIDYANNDSITSGGTFELFLPNNGFYNHSVGDKTSFRRRMIVKDDEGSSKKITSVVTWGGVKDPPNDPNEDNCNFSEKCFYTDVIMDGTWGEDI